ncbi:YihY/virulence factor BrkB family protein [Halosimplex salinum]|uniref:YihY/virulence factor BrkB family protein n=1 Tax=Halosimplex salinum TaxID=1710538 RepID=UPI001F403C47|nr:YihY/virulence factor BrkB family protein [Halosimplex salinum]
MVTLADARRFVKRVFADVSEKNVTFMAAGLAYNAFISLAPLLFVLFIALNVVGGGLEDRVVSAAQEWLPGPIAEVVAELFAGDPSAGGASVIGLVVLIWGALKIFRGLDTAFSEIYETTGRNSFLDKLRDGLVVFVALVLAVLATVGVSAAVALFADTVPLLSYTSPLVLLGGLLLAFLPMYYVFPDADLGIRDVLPGAAFAAVGWAAFQSLFQVYLAFSDPGSGSFFGGVIVVVTYLYFSALVLLLGAVINAVTGDHSSGRPGGGGGGGGGPPPPGGGPPPPPPARGGAAGGRPTLRPYGKPRSPASSSVPTSADSTNE